MDDKAKKAILSALEQIMDDMGSRDLESMKDSPKVVVHEEKVQEVPMEEVGEKLEEVMEPEEEEMSDEDESDPLVSRVMEKLKKKK